jgi:hypothetical protein
VSRSAGLKSKDVVCLFAGGRFQGRHDDSEWAHGRGSRGRDFGSKPGWAQGRGRGGWNSGRPLGGASGRTSHHAQRLDISGDASAAVTPARQDGPSSSANHEGPKSNEDFRKMLLKR